MTAPRRPSLTAWAAELEQDPEQTGITELGEFLEACGYRPRDYPNDWQRVYYHTGDWHPWTFDTSRSYVPRGYTQAILTYVRSKLPKEGP